MQSGELVAARMSGGVAIVRVVAVEDARVRVALRRKREARLPADRVILATQIVAEGDEALAAFREQSEALADDVALVDLWEVVRDEGEALAFDDLAELYWGAEASAAERVALLLRLDRDDLYFDSGKAGYSARSADAVEETLARRRRRAQNAADAEALAAALSAGELPSDLSAHQQSLMGDMREYAVFGDDYARGAAVKALLGKVQGNMVGKGASGGNPQRLAFETLVAIGEMAADAPLELAREGIDAAFSAEALAEADAVSDAEPLADARRVDLTALPVFTIDDADTADKDDALSLERLDETHNGAAVYRLGAHITDAGALIAPGGALDAEANRRMATLYIPEGAVPMLPAAVSQAKGSLESGESRAALSLLARVSADGELLGYEVKPSVIRSRAALSYEEADAAILGVNDGAAGGAKGLDGAGKAGEYAETLAALHALAGALKGRRELAGAVNIDKPEMQIRVAAPEDIRVRVIERDTPARAMVAECMVLCNSLLATFCRDNGIAAAYRTQAAPDLSDIGAGLPPGTALEDGPLRWYLMMRRFAPADIGTAPGAHNGLGVAAYIQATSPLRRYPDMVMQRQISHFLSAGEPLYSADEIASVAARADVQLRALGKLEAQRRTYWFMKYLKLRAANAKDDDGLLYDAVVLENRPRRSGMLELAEYPFRARAQLPGAVLPGERVGLRFGGADLWERRVSFTHVVE